MTTEQTILRRVRCDNCKRVYDPATLINARANDLGRSDYIIADGECFNCCASWTDGFGQFGPGCLSATYSVVGIKATTISSVKCGGRCVDGKSVECKCSCGGENHGMGAA